MCGPRRAQGHRSSRPEDQCIKGRRQCPNPSSRASTRPLQQLFASLPVLHPLQGMTKCHHGFLCSKGLQQQPSHRSKALIRLVPLDPTWRFVSDWHELMTFNSAWSTMLNSQHRVSRCHQELQWICLTC